MAGCIAHHAAQRASCGVAGGASEPSLPEHAGAILCHVSGRASDRGHLINRACLAISTVYLGWSVLAKTWVDDVFTRSLAAQNIHYHSMFTTPTPFNTLLWRAAVMDDSGYYEGYYSVLDDDADIEFVHYRSEQQLLADIGDHWAVQRLQWFTNGFYTVDRVGDAVVMSDLRMGVESSYVFRFQVGHISNPHPVPAEPARLPVYRDMEKLNFMLRDRVWGKTG